MRKTQFLRAAALFVAIASLWTPAAKAQQYLDVHPAIPPQPAVAPEAAVDPSAKPGAKIYITDSYGRLATVTLGTYSLHYIGYEGTVLTDIGFDPKDGNLYGVTFTGFYRVNVSTGQATFIGNLGISDANALVFDANGKAYIAGVNNRELWSVNIKTGRVIYIGATYPWKSAGDLTFFDNTLLLSGYEWSTLTNTTPDTLVELNPTNGKVLGTGPLDIHNLFGIVSTGTNLLYGFANTSVYQIFPWGNDIKKRTVELANFQSKGLGQIFGAAYNGDFQK